MREDIEKLKKSFKYIRSCMLIYRDGEVITIDVENQEELAFKLSILFDLNGLEEILIERSDGASYVRVYNDKLIYLDFSKKPNIPLLNMYLRRIFSKKSTSKVEPEKIDIKSEEETKPEEIKPKFTPKEEESEGTWEDVRKIFSMR